MSSEVDLYQSQPSTHHREQAKSKSAAKKNAYPSHSQVRDHDRDHSVTSRDEHLTALSCQHDDPTTTEQLTERSWKRSGFQGKQCRSAAALHSSRRRCRCTLGRAQSKSPEAAKSRPLLHPPPSPFPAWSCTSIRQDRRNTVSGSRWTRWCGKDSLEREDPSCSPQPASCSQSSSRILASDNTCNASWCRSLPTQPEDMISTCSRKTTGSFSSTSPWNQQG